MEFGAIFILVLVLIAVGLLGGGLYALTMWLRGRQLAPETERPERESPRPEHLEVENEQQARSVGAR